MRHRMAICANIRQSSPRVLRVRCRPFVNSTTAASEQAFRSEDQVGTSGESLGDCEVLQRAVDFDSRRRRRLVSLTCGMRRVRRQ